LTEREEKGFGGRRSGPPGVVDGKTKVLKSVALVQGTLRKKKKPREKGLSSGKTKWGGDL